MSLQRSFDVCPLYIKLPTGKQADGQTGVGDVDTMTDVEVDAQLSQLTSSLTDAARN